MAYVSQELKKSLAPRIKAVCKRYNIKASLGVRNHSTLVLNINKGKIDFIKNHNRMLVEKNIDRIVSDNINVNPYWLEKEFSGKALKFLEEVKAAMMEGNFDNSDIMTDYFNVGWYININIGKWDKPYELIS